MAVGGSKGGRDNGEARGEREHAKGTATDSGASEREGILGGCTMSVGNKSGTPRIDEAKRGKENNTQSSIAESETIDLTEDTHELTIEDQCGFKDNQAPTEGGNK